MLREDAAVVRARAERLASLAGGTVEETVARVGGGALPLAELPSFACAIEESLAAPLRGGEPPVVGIVRDGKLLLDCRTLADDEVDEVAAAAVNARRLQGRSDKAHEEHDGGEHPPTRGRRHATPPNDERGREHDVDPRRGHRTSIRVPTLASGA